MQNWEKNSLRFVLVVLEKAVKLTKTTADDKLLEICQSGTRNQRFSFYKYL